MLNVVLLSVLATRKMRPLVVESLLLHHPGNPHGRGKLNTVGLLVL
jgi:hypothetical protein